MSMLTSIPALPVQNIGAAVEFYQNKLGFFVRHKEERFAIAVRDAVELHLWAACDTAWRLLFWRRLSRHPVKSGAESFLAGTASCRILVDAVDELFEEYKTKGVLYSPGTIVELQPWGSREFPVLDHERNLITFYQPI
jgi:catechol 2,3-dioxygenase-like lactoylglutathione lyase family enzyme